MREERLWQRGPDGEIIRLRPATARRRSVPSPEPETGSAIPTGRARLGIGLRLGFRDIYDYLGAVLVMSVVATTLYGLALLGGHAAGASLVRLLPIRDGSPLAQFLALLCGLAGVVVVGGPLNAGLFRYARNAAARREPDLFDLTWGFREAAGRSIALGALQAAGTAILLADCWFFFAQRSPYWMALGVVFLYVLGFWGMASLYSWALLAELPAGPVQALRKSFLLVLDNFAYSLGLGLIALAVGGALWGTVVGAALLWPGGLALLLTQGTRELLRKYTLLPPDPTLDPIADESAD